MNIKDLFVLALYPACKPRYHLKRNEYFRSGYVDGPGFTESIYCTDETFLIIQTGYKYLILPAYKGDMNK